MTATISCQCTLWMVAIHVRLGGVGSSENTPWGGWKYYGQNRWWVSYLRIQNYGWKMAKRRKEKWLLRWFLKFLIFWFLEWDPFRCSHRAREVVLANELQASSFPMNKKWNVVDAFLVGFHLGKAFAACAFAVHRWMFPWSTTTLAAWLGRCAPYPTSHWMFFLMFWCCLLFFSFFFSVTKWMFYVLVLSSAVMCCWILSKYIYIYSLVFIRNTSIQDVKSHWASHVGSQRHRFSSSWW